MAKNSGGVAEDSIQSAITFFIGVLVAGLVGLLFLIIYGNLSGNLGFDAFSQGANDTNNVINNLTSGATQFFTFANVWFILLGVSVLIGIVIGLLVLVMRIRGVVSSSGGFSN